MWMYGGYPWDFGERQARYFWDFDLMAKEKVWLPSMPCVLEGCWEFLFLWWVWVGLWVLQQVGKGWEIAIQQSVKFGEFYHSFPVLELLDDLYQKEKLCQVEFNFVKLPMAKGPTCRQKGLNVSNQRLCASTWLNTWCRRLSGCEAQQHMSFLLFLDPKLPQSSYSR